MMSAIPAGNSLAYLVPLVGAGVALGVGFFEPRFLTTVATGAADSRWPRRSWSRLAQLMFVYVRAGQEGPNQYGPDPLRGFDVILAARGNGLLRNAEPFRPITPGVPRPPW